MAAFDISKQISKCLPNFWNHEKEIVEISEKEFSRFACVSIFEFLSFHVFALMLIFLLFGKSQYEAKHIGATSGCCKEHVWGFAMVECALAFWSLGGLRSARL